MTWTAPASDGNSPVQSYTVTGSPNGPVSVKAPTTTATLGGLPNGTQVCVQVQAINAVAGGALSPAGQSCATPVAPAVAPNAVTNLAVSAGDQQLTISWTAASVPAGSPAVTGYGVTVGSNPVQTVTGTSYTAGVPAWTTETVSVVAVNSAGNSPATTGSGSAWARSTSLVTCVNSLSGDTAYQNSCTNVGGAWSQVNSAPISWINAQGNAGGHTPSGSFEGLCSTYSSGDHPGEISGTQGWSGDVYGLASAPDNTACGAVQLYPQAPDTTHVIAAVSSSSLGSGSQHVCIYKGVTKGDNGSFTQDELAVCGTAPAGMSNYSQIGDFYT